MRVVVSAEWYDELGRLLLTEDVRCDDVVLVGCCVVDPDSVRLRVATWAWRDGAFAVRVACPNMEPFLYGRSRD